MKKAMSLLLCLIMVLSLVACGGAKEEAKAEAPAEAPAAEAPAAEAPAEAPAEEAKEVRTEVNLINEEVLASLDLMQTNKTFTKTVLVQVYEGLTADHEDGTWSYTFETPEGQSLLSIEMYKGWIVDAATGMYEYEK